MSSNLQTSTCAPDMEDAMDGKSHKVELSSIQSTDTSRPYGISTVSNFRHLSQKRSRWIYPYGSKDGHVGDFRTDLQSLLEVATGAKGRRMCTGCEVGRAQLKEINEAAAREEFRVSKSCISDRKAQVDDPVKQIDIEIERLDRIIGAVVGEGLDWRRRVERVTMMTNWREMSELHAEIQMLSKGPWELNLKLEVPGEMIDGEIEMLREKSRSLEMDMQSLIEDMRLGWLVDRVGWRG